MFSNPFSNPLTKYTAVLTAIVTGLHLFCTTWVMTADYVAQQLHITKEAVIEEVAQQYGYQRMVASSERKLTVQEFAEREALSAGINPSFVRAIIKVESNKNGGAMSPKGALGIMQVMPQHAKFCGLDGPARLVDDRENIRCGVKLLKDCKRQHGNSVVRITRCYNGSPLCSNGACKETEAYWPRVMATMFNDIS